MKTWLATGATALALAVFISLTVAPQPQLSSAASKTVVRNAKASFDKNHITLRFAALSDTHQTGREGSYAGEQFREALEMLKGLQLDAVAIAGDVTDLGTASEISQFKRTYQRHLGKTPLVYSLGNHDGGHDAKPGIPNQGNSAELYKSVLGPGFFRHDRDPSMIGTGNRYVKIHGYNFIAVEPEGYYGETPGRAVYFSEATLDWLKATLKKVAAKDPSEPIFVLTHAAPYRTVYGSTLPPWKGWYGTYLGNYTTDLTPILKRFPQVVTISGHTHFPTNDERSIMQTDFTSLNAGAVYYGSIEGGYEPQQDYQWPSELSTFSQGLLVEIDRDDNMRVTRLDFFNNAVIKKPWIVDAPRRNGSHLDTYSRSKRRSKNARPSVRRSSMMVWRNPDAEGSGRWSAGLKFTAGTDDDLIHHYEVKLTKGDETVKSWKISSEFYMEPQTRKMRSSFMIYDIGLLDADAQYAVELVAVDSWEAKSPPKTFRFETSATPQGGSARSGSFTPDSAGRLSNR